jgi:hypothetical protein
MCSITLQTVMVLMVQHTGIHKGTTSCVFDEHFFFTLPNLNRSDIEALTVTVCAATLTFLHNY